MTSKIPSLFPLRSFPDLFTANQPSQLTPQSSSNWITSRHSTDRQADDTIHLWHVINSVDPIKLPPTIPRVLSCFGVRAAPGFKGWLPIGSFRRVLTRIRSGIGLGVPGICGQGFGIDVGDR